MAENRADGFSRLSPCPAGIETKTQSHHKAQHEGILHQILSLPPVHTVSLSCKTILPLPLRSREVPK
ncbi:hypothetical protein [uncultured Dialister sp.]|uniref:hypothetical protein n=1 Tax=Dialister succinatiphilus TaxID=487173 RepID=UPI0026706BA5|nr:hypothetical protein [uncultured Dialister sp.]